MGMNWRITSNHKAKSSGKKATRPQTAGGRDSVCKTGGLWSRLLNSSSAVSSQSLVKGIGCGRILELSGLQRAMPKTMGGWNRSVEGTPLQFRFIACKCPLGPWANLGSPMLFESKKSPAWTLPIILLLSSEMGRHAHSRRPFLVAKDEAYWWGAPLGQPAFLLLCSRVERWNLWLGSSPQLCACPV